MGASADVRVVPLDHPLGDRKAVEVRRPLVRDHLLAARRAAESAEPGKPPSDQEREAHLLAAMCGLDYEELVPMDLADFMRCRDVLLDFLEGPGRPPTSGSSGGPSPAPPGS